MSDKPDNLTEASPGEMLATLNETSIATWSDTRRKDFAGTFDARVRAARLILLSTAAQILEGAERRKFISSFHTRRIADHGPNLKTLADQDKLRGMSDYYFDAANATCGGRSYHDLKQIAKERADLVLSELPPLKTAVQIIDPETAAKIDRRAKLKEQGQALVEELEEVTEAVSMADLDQKMTIGEFRALVKERDNKRRKLIQKLNEIGREGTELEDSINKKLFKGLPGLSDAVIDAFKLHIDRAKALDELSRRVSEKVLFGDSEAAMSLLKMFEEDEAALPGQIRNSIKEALAKLNLAKPQKAVKQLKSKK